MLFELINSGVGIRQCGRILGLSLRCTEIKLRKMGRHAAALNESLLKPLEGEVRFHLDEFETFEGQRNARPLTVPTLLHSDSRYLAWSESAPIRPRGSMPAKRLEAIARSEARHGPRQDASRASLVRTLRIGARLAGGADRIVLQMDEKKSYPGLARAAFVGKRIELRRTSSELPRTTGNPMFAINHEEARMRDLMGRLRRESWLVSKKSCYLDLALQLYMLIRNTVRLRFLRDDCTPAMRIGLLGRRLTLHEALGWRQEWGTRSIHPLSERGSTIEAWHRRATAAA